MTIKIPRIILIGMAAVMLFALPLSALAAGDDPTGSNCIPIPGYGFGVSKCLSWITFVALDLIFFIVGVFITIAAAMINLLIQMSQGVLSSDIVSQGFAITLGLANLGFVLMIIVIAFATILRIERYELKKTLRNLIIAAILVNFSLTIAGVIIDFTNVLGNFFLAKATINSDLGTKLAQSLKIQNLIEVKDAGSLGSILEFGAGILSNIVSLLLGVIFSIIIVVVFFGIGIMLLVRYVFLILLLILMPLAWLFWVIPDLSQYWSKWWSNFLKWNFFLPAVMFFIYLALLAGSNIDTLVANTVATDKAADAASKIIINKGGIALFMQVLIKIGLFMGALLAGNALGIAGAGGALAIAKKVSSSPLTAGKSFGKGFLGPGFNKRLEEGAKNLGKKAAEKTAQFTSKVPLLRGAASMLSTPVAKETQKIRGKQAAGIEAGGKEILGSVQRGEQKISEVKQAAKRTFKNSLPPIPFTGMANARRERAMNIMALAKMEKNGQYEARVKLPEGEFSDAFMQSGRTGGEEHTARENIGAGPISKGLGAASRVAYLGGVVRRIPGAGLLSAEVRNARMKNKIEKLKGKGEKVEKEEKEEKETALLKKLMKQIQEESGEKGGGKKEESGGEHKE